MNWLNNIQAWLDYFACGLIDETQLSYALEMHCVGNSQVRISGYNDMLTANVLCSVYGIHIPIVTYESDDLTVHPTGWTPDPMGIPTWHICPHFISGKYLHYLCKHPPFKKYIQYIDRNNYKLIRKRYSL